MTEVACKYKQGEHENYCLFFCVASMLFYRNYKKAAKRLKGMAEGYKSVDGNQQIKDLLGFLRQHAKQFGKCVKFGRGRVSKSRKELYVSDLLDEMQDFPVLVIPRGNDGMVSHAVCVVDDLVFDSTQACALKLTRETFDWICGDDGCGGIWEAYMLRAWRCPDMRPPKTKPHF